MSIERAPHQLSTVDILFELDKKDLTESQKESLVQELKNRELDKPSFDEAISTFKRIKSEREKRANESLSLGLKILCILLPFVVSPKGENNYTDTFTEHWTRAGYKRKLIEYYKYSFYGSGIYFILIMSFLVFSKTKQFKQLETEEFELGKKINSERIEKGVPIIESDWYTNDRGYKSKYLWSNFETMDIPYHKEKEVYQYDHKEIDRYEYNVNDTLTAMVETHFSFFLPDSLNPWTCSYIKITDGLEYDIQSKSISLNQVDSILNKWNLSRIK